MNTETYLQVKNITKEYPGVMALQDVSVTFKPGEVHALVGENGAGKSTLVKIISGAEIPTQGEILYRGQKYSHMTPHLSKMLNIGVIYQEFNLIPTLSVAENLYLGDHSDSRHFINQKVLEQKTKEIFSSMNIRIDPKALVENLSVAHMQLVEIAKVVSKDINILILDEPTAPLTLSEVNILFAIIQKLKQKGIAIIYISHRLEEIFEICDKITILRDGKFIISKPTKETNRQELISYMVGRTLKETFPERPKRTAKKKILEVDKVTGNGVNDINFAVHEGEILGIGGLVGAGRTELVRLLFGAVPLESGEIIFKGKKLQMKQPKDAVRIGIGMVPEDRKNHGVLLEAPVSWNISLSIINRLSRFWFINNSSEEKIINKNIKELSIKTPSPKQLVKNLSGGNQQKIALAKWLASDCKLLILDEPTRGVDVGAKWEIYQSMNMLANQGIAIIMISSEMHELLGMSDRMMVLSEGSQMGILERKDFNQEVILDLASGNL